MMFSRLKCLRTLLVCLVSFGIAIFHSEARAQAPEPPKPKPAQQPPPAEPKKANPFEQVPQATPDQAPKPKPQLEAPKPAVETKPGEAPPQDIIEAIEFRGARRVPQDTLRALIFSKKGDRYDAEALHRDFMALWNTGRFDDIRIERETGPAGWIVRFVVVERRVVRSIKYDGAKSVTVSEILDRFKERRVGLSVESQYDPNKVQRAANVLREFLAERGRQFATVDPDVRQIPPSSLEVTFRVNEGPKVKVGEINIDGNQVFSDKAVRRAMRHLRPIGIPYSLLFENMFSKTFDISKLEEDKEGIRNFYMERGYFLGRAAEHTVNLRDVGGGKFRIPLFYPNKPGKRADLKINVEEGRQYHLNKINFVGVKLFRTPDTLMRPVFQMGEGDVFSTAKLRKGIEEMRKLYGQFGYIDFVPEPSFDPLPGTDKIDLTLSIDEGSQFFVRRIDFTGNTTTRDKVIRRELLIDEGDIFNTRFWELSVLRLNQLGYFEVLKENEAADIKRDPKSNTVDITLKVKERGKNSVQLNGGVSGIAGSFIGFSYSTNNFLGLGETLTLSSQVGDRIRDVTFGFTEPYFLDKPIQVGFTVYTQRFNFDQGREVGLLTGRDVSPIFDQLGAENRQRYITNGYGFNVYASTLLRRSFARVGISYGYDRSNVTPLSEVSKNLFQFAQFQNISGPNQLQGINTSRVVPSYTYNTIDHPITPSRGKSIYIATSVAGGPLQGNVNMIEPTIDFKYFRAGFKRGHVIGYHALGRFLTGYGGKTAPPFNRFFMGGENDIRGFDIWQISPVAYVPSSGPVNVLNDDGSARMQRVIEDGVEVLRPITQTVPIYQFTLSGGDTQIVNNLEYRIPIVGPVVLAAFLDAGINKIALTNQLRINPERVSDLNNLFPQAGFTGKVPIAPGSQKMRVSTGLELQVMMPVVNAPFRFYWAYNPSILQSNLQPPIVFDRSMFPNLATFREAVRLYGSSSNWFEDRRTFRFTISRTF